MLIHQHSPLRASSIAPTTPTHAQSRVGPDGSEYELVFSDEFDADGRSFYKGASSIRVLAPRTFISDALLRLGEDQVWEADRVFDARITTQNGSLTIVPSDPERHRSRYMVAVVRSRTPFCLRDGFVEDRKSVV